MKKRCLRLSDIKEEIMAYEGKEVKLAVNKGRNNVVKFEKTCYNVLSLG